MAKTTRTCRTCGAQYNIYLDNDKHSAMTSIDTKQGRVYVCANCTTDTPVNDRIVGTPKRHGYQYRIVTDASIGLLPYGYTLNGGLCYSPLYNGLCAPSKLDLRHCSISIYNSKYDDRFWDVLGRNCTAWVSTDCITIETDDVIPVAQCWTEILSKCWQLYCDINDADIMDVNMQYSIACIMAKHGLTQDEGN